MNVEQKIEKIRSRLKTDIKNAEQVKADFEKSFADHPYNALEWSNNLFTHAARERLAKSLLRDVQTMIDDPIGFAVRQDIVDTIVRMVRDELVFIAAKIPSSSDHVSNLLAQETTAATARMYEFLLSL